MDPKFHLNIAVCDDQQVMLQEIEALSRKILEDQYDLNFISSQDPEQLMHSEQVFHIALLDVKLLETSGIEAARKILAVNPGCRILFLSGYVSVVSDVYDVPHFCFVLKEQMEEKLPKFLLQAAELSAQEAGCRLSVKSGKEILLIPLAQIMVLERRGHLTHITLSDGSGLATKEKISSLQSRLGSANFIRCHISYLVNLSFVRSVRSRVVYLRSGLQIPVSLSHEQEVQNAFFRRMSK